VMFSDTHGLHTEMRDCNTCGETVFVPVLNGGEFAECPVCGHLICLHCEE